MTGSVGVASSSASSLGSADDRTARDKRSGGSIGWDQELGTRFSKLGSRNLNEGRETRIL